MVLQDWGGGGIFITNGSASMRILDSLITENHADGFGGGLGGCSTGRIFEDNSADVNVNHGAAIYGNTAYGTGLSSSGSSKHDDHDAHNNPVFMEGNRFQDVFSALGCQISRFMLGQGEANWEGSCDYKPVEQDTATAIVSSKMLGLTARPSEEAKNTAEGLARVIISGNSSGTHGGGIMCNGLLMLGNMNNLVFDDSLRINFRKDYKDEAGENVPVNHGQFTFVLLDQEKISGMPDSALLECRGDGTVTYNGSAEGVTAYASTSADPGNHVQLLVRYLYQDVFGEAAAQNPRVFRYYLLEVPPADSDITCDSTVYEAEVAVTYQQSSLTVVGDPLSITYLYIQDMNIKKDGQTLEASKEYNSDYNGGTLHHGASITINSQPLFENRIRERPLEFAVYKTNEQSEPLEYVGFTLDKLDASGRITERGTMAYTDADGTISFTVPKTDGNYLLSEAAPHGYDPAGPWMVQVRGESISFFQAVQNGGSYQAGAPADSSLTDGNTFHIINKRTVYKLPETGGAGRGSRMLAALFMIALSITLGFRQQKHRHVQKGR